MKILLTLLIFAVLSTPSIAQETADSHAQAAEELLITMNLPEFSDSLVESMVETQIRYSPELHIFEDIFVKFLRKYMSWENMREFYVDMYVEHFTEDEIREITAFYQTDTGQKVISLELEMMQKGMEWGEQIVEENLPELEQMLEERVKELEVIEHIDDY